ncbi:MAG: hypothetical protein GC190_16040 [Alphaproteobacteria bacterium]|nr:hypothetical protein [Alphaproteobacteria bacterium]
MVGLAGVELSTSLTAVAGEVTRTTNGIFDLAFAHPVLAIKGFAGLTALSSFVSNWRVLAEVRASIVSCTRPLNFTGLRIGPSEPYIAPLRNLFFWYAMFVFYQLISQFTGAVGDPDLTGAAAEFVVQLSLVLVVYSRWRSIVAVGRRAYEEEGV